jgi:hypothetical protein
MKQRRLTKQTIDILNRMDVDAALKNVAVLGFIPDTREIAEAGLHKVRIMIGGAFTRQQRDESRAWLAAHGFKVPGRKR